MITVRSTSKFDNWLTRLRDDRARARIVRRIDRLRFGNFGDAKSVGDGVSELRIDYGPGYRIYYVRRDASIVVLLCGGDKAGQSRDIAAAKRMAAKEGLK